MKQLIFNTNDTLEEVYQKQIYNFFVDFSLKHYSPETAYKGSLIKLLKSQKIKSANVLVTSFIRNNFLVTERYNGKHSQFYFDISSIGDFNIHNVKYLISEAIKLRRSYSRKHDIDIKRKRTELKRVTAESKQSIELLTSIKSKLILQNQFSILSEFDQYLSLIDYKDKIDERIQMKLK